MPSIMPHHLQLRVAIGLCLGLLLVEPSAIEAKTEKVTLKNGKTYEVRTKKGMPFPFESDQIRIDQLTLKGIMEVDSTVMQFTWTFTAHIKAEGAFHVTVTTPMDETISATFECTGPGEISETFFPSDDYPALWEWQDAPSTSWIPFHFTFAEEQTGDSFSLTQWLKFDSNSKAQQRQVLKDVLNSLDNPLPEQPDGSASDDVAPRGRPANPDRQQAPTQKRIYSSAVEPVKFKKVWYRTLERRNFFKAMKASGELTVYGNRLVFSSKTLTLEILGRDIQNVSRGRMPGDDENSWVMIDYVDGSVIDVAGFKDGHFWIHDTTRILSTIKSMVDYARFTESGSAAFPEKIRLSFDKREWIVGARSQDNKHFIEQYFLPGENLKNWTERVTLHVLPGAQEQVTARNIMVEFRDNILKNCPSAIWTVLQESANQIVYEWQTIDCPVYDNHYAVGKMIEGQSAIHRIGYENRALPLEDGKRNEWRILIGGAHLEVLEPNQSHP